MRDLTARTAPPGTLAPDGRLREVRTAADRLDIAVAHFEAALTEVPDMLATYAGLVRNGSQQVSLTRAESRALRMMLAHALAEVRTLDHLALVRHRDAAARDDAGHALLAELEARVAALEARLGTGGA